jgi:alkylhydroperoxidase/carboxymuconolactone decarboxylase family protein YurZ
LITELLLINNCPVIKIYEALLQTYLFAGFPSALISLKRFNEMIGKKKVYKGYDIKKYMDRGQRNCKIIYGNKYDKLISNIKSFSPEMAEWMIVEGYGKVLGRKGLSLLEREICIISILSALKFKEQLYSHINGARRIRAEFELIAKVINNLELISAKSSANFGKRVLSEYQSKYPIKLF